MLLSDAWKELTKSQQCLYLYCKAQYYGEKTINGDPECFTLNKDKWQRQYGLYKKGNEHSFYTDMNALISHGFVLCAERGDNTRTKNIYKYSARWRDYGTNRFDIPQNEKTQALINQEDKVKKEG